MARKNAVVSVAVEGAVITFTVEGQKKPITLDTSKDLTDDVASRALIHGIVQKISDAAALGKDATPADKFEAMLSVRNRIAGPDGEWSKRSGEGSGVVGGVIFRALRNIKPEIDEGKLRTWYDAKTRSEQLALRTNPDVAAEIERIKAERGANTNVDADALLADLDNL